MAKPEITSAQKIMGFVDPKDDTRGELILEDVLPDGTENEVDGSVDHLLAIASVPGSRSTETVVLIGILDDGKMKPSRASIIIGSFQDTLNELTKQGFRMDVAPVRGPKVAVSRGLSLEDMGLKGGQR